MNRPTVIVFALAGLLGVFALILVLRLPPPPNPVPRPSDQMTSDSTPKSGEPRATAQNSPEAFAPLKKEPTPTPADSEPIPNLPTSATASNKKTGGTGTKAPIQDVEARAALTMVGLDLDAEEYWVSAINDPTLSPEERKDLIEDLNEEGLSDPKHPTEADLELIANRLELIENLAPNSMDQVNFDAFQEAYKDLSNMLAGKPVK